MAAETDLFEALIHVWHRR